MPPSYEVELRQLWRALLPSRDALRTSDAFDDLVGRYAEPGRYYHNLLHIHEVVRAMLDLPGALPREVLLAAFLHDVVYDSRASDNEERSAEYARELLKALGIDLDRREETARLILLTKTHDPSEEDRSGCILVDADLAILGEKAEAYNAYASAIRQEYAWVPQEDYRAGRRQVLERFLARPRIYRTPEFQTRERIARANLANEITSLR